MASYQLDFALGSHRGRMREKNEDAVAYHYPSDWEILNHYGALFVLADGVGGLANGAEIAELTLRRLIEIYYQENLLDPAETLRQSIQKINAELYQHYHAQGATTLVAVVICQDEAIIAHVGDSRAYYKNNLDLIPLTQDHAAEIVSRGKVKRKLTRALGYRAAVEVSLNSQKLQTSDTLLLLTDGVLRYYENETLENLLAENPRETVQNIIEA